MENDRRQRDGQFEDFHVIFWVFVIAMTTAVAWDVVAKIWP